MIFRFSLLCGAWPVMVNGPHLVKAGPLSRCRTPGPILRALCPRTLRAQPQRCPLPSPHQGTPARCTAQQHFCREESILVFPTAMTSQQTEDIQEAFCFFCKSKGDGKLRPTEVGDVMRACGVNPTAAELKAILKSIDPSGAGVNMKTFTNMVLQEMNSRHGFEDELKAAFQCIDTDGSGTISAKELKHYMTRLGEKLTENEVDEMIRNADINGDGEIDWSEFVSMMVVRH